MCYLNVTALVGEAVVVEEVEGELAAVVVLSPAGDFHYNSTILADLFSRIDWRYLNQNQRQSDEECSEHVFST